tara:strand:+ start:278 stop:568 length:291 start_codon:yes stop_codon:yes gene_type:complete
MTKDEIFDKIDDIYSEHDGGTIYLSDERTERLKEIIQQAINFIPCCTELPTKETINTVASNKALKYAYANEDTYEDYVKAIEEGADYVKNYLTKHK